ncbi:hypothetical protein BDZ91DRAFT_662932, partial [Kalaharituber pfeilii]
MSFRNLYIPLRRRLASSVLALICTFKPAIAQDNADETAAGFSDTFISDLGPLLALFGEQVTIQFMSRTMSWSENIIFSMAPLGAITAVVSAIRVSGPTRLKATIGRARESRGAVEVDLMSSTSPDVCELWNGSQIVRVAGSAPMARILYFPEEREKNPERSGLYNLEEAKKQGLLTRKQGAPRTFTAESTSTFSSCTSYPPNISINLASRRPDLELWATAVFAIILQGGVLVAETLVAYHPSLQKRNRNSPLPISSGLSVTIAGTVCLVIGMLLCSYIVEKSTTETYWRTTNGQKFRLFWVQQAQTVSDESFDSFILFAKDEKDFFMTSHPADVLYSMVVFATFISILGFLAFATGLRALHWSATIAQLGATVVMTIVRSWVRFDVARRPIATRLPKGFELDWLATRL